MRRFDPGPRLQHLRLEIVTSLSSPVQGLFPGIALITSPWDPKVQDRDIAQGYGAPGFTSLTRVPRPPIRRRSALPTIEDLELVTRVGGEEGGYVTEALRKGGGRQEGVLALAQVVIVEVNGEREHIDSQRV